MTREDLMERAQKEYDDVMQSKPKDPMWPSSPYYMRDAVSAVLYTFDDDELFHFIDNLPSWDEMYIEDLMKELAGRYDLDPDDYEDYDDIFCAISQKREAAL